ncbi:MAG: carbohydrate-binding protein [Terracidiphilus sp.]
MRTHETGKIQRLLVGLAASLLAALLAGCGGGTKSPPPPPPAAATPTFSPASGTYGAAQTVTIADATAGAVIYYTTDGTTPSTLSSRYTAALSVTSTETIEALATAPGYTASAVGSATFTIRIPGPAVSVVASSDDGTLKLTAQPSTQFFSGSGGSNPVYVDETESYQTIEGFGAAFTDTAAYNLNEVATAAAHSEAVNNLFTRNGQGIGLSFMRAPMAASDLALSVYSYDDQPAGKTDPTLAGFSIDHDRKDIIPLILEAKSLNPAMKLMANPWSPPGWMKSNDSMVNGGTLLPQFYSAFADYFVKYVQTYEQAGVTVDYISIQNEPTYTTTYPSMDLEAAGATTVLSQYVLPALAANKIGARVLLLDNNYYLIAYPETELANSTIANSSQVAGVAWHGYSLPQGYMQLLQNKYPNLGQYETEHSGGAWNADQFKTDFEDITAVMRSSGKTFVKWSLAVNENYGPETNGCSNCYGMVSVNSKTGAVTYTADYYTLGQFSKFIFPGAKRIYSSNAQGILSSAFANPDGSKVLVAFNDTAAPVTFQVSWGAQSFSYILPRLTASTYTWSGTQTGSSTTGAKTAIQASSYHSLDNLMTEDTSDTDAGYDLGYASDGSHAVYKNVDFGSSVSGLTARVAADDSGATIEFHLDSPTGALVASVAVPDTGGWQNWTTQTVAASGASGVHDLYVVYRNMPANLNWFVFN